MDAWKCEIKIIDSVEQGHHTRSLCLIIMRCRGEHSK